MPKKRSSGIPVCKNCKDGFHEDHGRQSNKTCLGNCGCFCQLDDSPVVLLSPLRHHHAADDALGEVFITLRNAGVQCKATTDMRLVWKPKPELLPDEVRQLLRQYAGPLACLLMPGEHLRPAPPFWTVGSLDECVGCGSSCASRDPLGVARHPWCGWIGQVKQTVKVVQVRQYPSHLTVLQGGLGGSA